MDMLRAPQPKLGLVLRFEKIQASGSGKIRSGSGLSPSLPAGTPPCVYVDPASERLGFDSCERRRWR